MKLRFNFRDNTYWLKTYWPSLLIIFILFIIYFKDIVEAIRQFKDLLIFVIPYEKILHNEFFLAFIIGYVVVGILADFLLKEYASALWNRSKGGVKEANLNSSKITVEPFFWHIKYFEWASRRIGILERVLYTSAIVFNQYTLIGVWLVLKAIGTWDDKFASEIKVGRVRINNFLIGTSLSLIFGILGGVLFKSIIDKNYLLNLLK